MRRTVLLVLAFSAGFGCVKPLGLEERRERRNAVESLLTAATKSMRQGGEQSLKEAESALNLAREISPQDARLIDGLGCIAYRRGNLDLAERYFKTAITRDLFYDRAYAHWALIAELRGRRELAETLHRQALALNPLNYRARNNYAVLLSDGNQFEAAIMELEKASHSSKGRIREIEHNLRLLKSHLKGASKLP